MPRMRAARAAATPLPWRQMAAVLAVQHCEAFQINVLFPFVVFMIRDFGIADREEHVGRLAGLLAASFCLASFSSGFLWGHLSDRLGRKRVILLGVFGTGVATAVFGTAKSYPQALAGRILAGLLSGNIGVLKSFLAEITDASNRARAFSYLPLTWGIGCIIAPFVGGVLSRPAVQYPDWEWGPFETFPCLLPCLVGMGLQAVTVVLVIFLMEEPGTQRQIAKSHGSQGDESFVMSLEGTVRQDDHAGLLAADQQAISIREESVPEEMEARDAEEAGDAGPLAKVRGAADEAALPSLWVVVRQRKCVLTNVLYMSYSLISICVDEILPVLMATPHAFGGLDLESSRIGGMLMAGGVALVATTLGLTPRLLARVRLRTVFQAQWLLLVPIVVAYPYMHHLDALSPTAALVATEVLICLRQCVNGVAFTTIILMMTNACPMAYLGAMNGIGQSLVSFARAFGPALAGVLWSASITPDLAAWFPLRQATLFILLGVVGVLALALGVLLPRSIQDPYEEPPPSSQPPPTSPSPARA